MRTIAALWLLGLSPAAALAQSSLNPGIEVQNDGRVAITELALRPNGSAAWGDNALSGRALESGQNISIREASETNCQYQVRAVFRDGRTEELPADVCQHQRVVFGRK